MGYGATMSVSVGTPDERSTVVEDNGPADEPQEPQRSTDHTQQDQPTAADQPERRGRDRRGDDRRGRDEQRELYRTMDLALRIGEVVLSSGAGTADATATILAVTAAGGLRGCEVDITFTSIAISYQAAPDVAPETHM